MSLPSSDPERRRADRRTERRNAESRGDKVWFGSRSTDASGEPDARSRALETDSQFQGQWPQTRMDGVDLDLRSSQPQTPSRQTAFERIYRLFLGARAALGLALVLALIVAGAFGVRPSSALAVASVVYASLALSLWLPPRFAKVNARLAATKLSRVQWVSTIGVDLVFFAALHLLAPTSNLNLVALLVLPVLMAGVLTRRAVALATAAAVALGLLASAWLEVMAGGEPLSTLMQAGLAGIGLFVITTLAGELASRLAREELAAKGSLEMARQQAQLNRLVIEEMQDGVLVVDRRGRVRAANPAAQRLLAPAGMCQPAPFPLRNVPAWGGLVHTIEDAFAQGSWPEEGRDVVLAFEAGTSRTVRVRIRFTRRNDLQSIEDYGVLLLEDVRSMQARTRQEKLAAMGRVSAGIAHEIRNPLAAIAQANSLMSEDAVTPSQRQLTRMVNDNVERLKRIVDDVMEVVPGSVQAAGVIDVTVIAATACEEWAHGGNLISTESGVLRIDLPNEPLGAVFDPDQLRRVLVNLLDNAHRHSSQRAGSVRVALQAPTATLLNLCVSSDGPPISPDVEQYLFEPFFSTRSRGTGLGLYICKELCERYGASIEYKLQPPSARHRNEFVVSMRRQASRLSSVRPDVVI